MKLHSLPLVAVLAAISAPAFAATAVAPAITPMPSATGSVAFDATSGPVTVRSVTTTELPNAADYRVSIADLDSNHDGRLSRSEVPASHALASEFKLVDRNHDGRITASELQNWR